MNTMIASDTEADGSAYFLYHSIGIFPDKARLTSEALAHFAQCWGRGNDAQWPQSLNLRQQFIDHWRRLIGAAPGTLTTAENVTAALHNLISSLPARYLRGKRLLVAADCFPSLHFLLAGMAERYGFVLDTVRLRRGEMWVREEDIFARWDGNVGIALLTQVTSTSSYRCDLTALMEHGRGVGTLIGVDITQGVGLLPFNVRALEADFVVSTSLKWLCGTAGAGILYARESLLKECQPELRGWFSQEDIFNWDIDRFTYANDARRFDHGTPSVFACAASLPALEWHSSQDAATLLAHNRALVSVIADEATVLGFSLAGPAEPERRGGSLMLRPPSHVDSRRIVAELRSNDIYCDCRGTILRLSPGCLTTPLGVEKLLQQLRHFKAAAA